jgi:hypothetical protein
MLQIVMTRRQHLLLWRVHFKNIQVLQLFVEMQAIEELPLK